eukprot:1160199-Pyramimonas_sp.AAC.1
MHAGPSARDLPAAYLRKSQTARRTGPALEQEHVIDGYALSLRPCTATNAKAAFRDPPKGG